jgi:hypothetical protein
VSKYHSGLQGQLQRSLPTDCAGSWERRKQQAAISCTVPILAHSCLVPVNFATTNVFKQLDEKQKAARHTRACDYRHLLLLLPFILSNLFREEVEEHNTHHRAAPVIDPSEELIGVTNVFLRWYKLFRQTTPGKTAAEINILRSLSDR